jgi:hypothetical protein
MSIMTKVDYLCYKADDGIINTTVAVL